MPESSRYVPRVWHSRCGTLARVGPEPPHLGALRGLHAAVAQVSSPCQPTRAASAPVIRRRSPMAVMRSGASLTRRRFLTTAASSAVIAAAGGIAKPALSRAADRPVITHGVQSGDVSVDSAIVWARADRASRMLVEVATSESFKNIRSAVFVDALPETDFTAKALLEGLPAGQDVFYRIRFQDHSFPSALGSPQV